MKKCITVLVCLVFVLSVMTGCGNSAENDVRPGNDINRPGVNDNVDMGNDGIIGEGKDPSITDHPVTDEVENGVDNAGDAVRRGMDSIGNAARNAVDDMKR